MDKDFRDRTFSTKPECTQEALHVETPDSFDVAISTIRSLSRQEIQGILAKPKIVDQLKTNAIDSNSSPANAAQALREGVELGHTRTNEEELALLHSGQLSLCLIISEPSGADLLIDGQPAGKLPQGFKLMRHGDLPRTITVKMEGYENAEKSVFPDGKDIALKVVLAKVNQ